MGRSFTKEQLRNKMNKLRIDYTAFKKLLDTTGFGWNSITRTATVDDDTVWERAIQANPTWSKFKKNGLACWLELCMIFGDSYARGDRSKSATEDIDDTVPVSIDEYSPGPNNPIDVGLDDLDETPSQLNPSRNLDRTPTAKRKRSMTSDVSRGLHDLGKFVNWRINKSGTEPSVTSASPSVGTVAPRTYPISECQAILDSMFDITKEVYIKAQRRMWEDPGFREAFICSIPENRKWILDAIP